MNSARKITPHYEPSADEVELVSLPPPAQLHEEPVELPLHGPPSAGLGRRLSAFFAGVRAAFGPREQAPARSADGVAAASLLAELGPLHEAVVEAIRSASALSENGVVSAGAALGKIVEEAIGQAAMVKDQGGEGDSTLGEDLASLGASIRTYTGALGALVEDVNEEVRMALAHCQEIALYTADCGAIVNNGRYLTMMMKVEVARLPDAENVGFIADEVRAFTDGLEKLLDEVEEITTGLGDELRGLGRGGAELAKLGADDATSFGQALAKVDASARAMAAIVYGTEGGNDALAGILRLSQDALSRFQFHDPMAQDLQTIDILLAELRTELAGRYGDGETVVPLLYRKRVGDDAPVDPSQAAGGELLMF